MNMYNILENSAKKYPDKIAISDLTNKITYQDLFQKVNIVSKCILTDYPTVERIALIMYNSIDLIICIFACAKLKKKICLINPWKDNQIKEKLSIAKVDLIICEENIIKNIDNIDFVRILYRFGEKKSIQNYLDKYNDTAIVDYIPENDKRNILIQSTSGTTGNPKLTYRTHENIDKDSDNIISTFNYDINDTVYVCVPITHGYGLTMGLLAAIKKGLTIIIEPWFMVNHFFSKVSPFYQSIILVGSPEIYKIMTEYVINRKLFVDLHNIKWLFTSGSCLPAELALAFYETFGRWINQTYGMMEISTISANLTPNRDNYLSVGKAVDNVYIKLVNNVVYVKSNAMSKVYLNQCQELLYSGDYFITQDKGYWDKQGNLYLQRREG